MIIKQIKSLASLAGTQTRARFRHYCTRVCAPYLEVMCNRKKGGFNGE